MLSTDKTLIALRFTYLSVLCLCHAIPLEITFAADAKSLLRILCFPSALILSMFGGVSMGHILTKFVRVVLFVDAVGHIARSLL